MSDTTEQQRLEAYLCGDRKITEEQARRLWDKIQEDGENLDFETFYERLKEVFEP